MGKKLSNSEFIERAAQSNPTVRPLDPYINGKTNMRFECMQCGNIWSARPSKILYRGHGCPVCGHIKAWDGRRVTEGQFVERLNEKHPLLTLISGYVGTQDKAKFYCRNCAQEFEASPNAVLHTTGCPICAASDAEQRITQYLMLRNYSFKRQFSFDDLVGRKGRLLKFDFAVFSNEQLLCLLEYDGEFHFFKSYDAEKFEMYQRHDALKDKYCREHGIRLIRIPYWEKKNLISVLDSYFDPYVKSGTLPDFPSEASKLFATLFE